MILTSTKPNIFRILFSIKNQKGEQLSQIWNADNWLVLAFFMIELWNFQDELGIFFAFFLWSPLDTKKKKSCLNKLKCWEASRNCESSSSWKFHNSILKNTKTSELSASISEKVVPLWYKSLLSAQLLYLCYVMTLLIIVIPNFRCRKHG